MDASASGALTFTAVDSKALESMLHADIPLSAAMGLTVQGMEASILTLRAPLGPNHNHKCTMFGGSLYCLAVAAGWAWLHVHARAAGLLGHVVIQGGDIAYPLPVSTDALAICTPVEHGAWERFCRTFVRHGKARISVQAVVRAEGEGRDAVRFTGHFVLHR